MKVKITFDPDGVYGFEYGNIVSASQLIESYITGLNEVEDADTIQFLKSLETEKAVDFIAQMWELEYDIIPDDTVIRKCSVCGKDMTEGYVFDGTDCFCSYDCTANFFNGDRGCVEILLDEGERLYWMDSLPTPPHYKVNIGYADANNFHYCDSRQKVYDWLSERIGTKFETVSDIEAYNENHQRAQIDVILFEPKSYYQYRSEYVAKIEQLNTVMGKAQRARKDRRMRNFLKEFSIIYDNANALWDFNPEVWQGEI